MIPQLLLALAAAVIALAIIVHVIRRRPGRSAMARRWMGDVMFPRTFQERMTVLGWPALAGLCLCFALATLPAADGTLRLPAALLTTPFFLALVVTRISTLPLPAVLYPRWARTQRRLRREHRARRGASPGPDENLTADSKAAPAPAGCRSSPLVASPPGGADTRCQPG